MIFDANAWVGHWPFRSLPRTSVAQLLREMDRHGIDKALVGNLHGLFYKDAHEANRELVKEIRRHRDRLFPCAAVNPTYGGWQDDLKQCREEFGMPVLRLTPEYHGYRLDDGEARQLVQKAHETGLKVALSGRIVDSRGRHRLDPGREIDARSLRILMQQVGPAPFLMLNFGGVLTGDPFDRHECCYGITRMLGKNGLRLEEEIHKHGPERFLFGTTMLLRYGAPVCLALDACALTEEARQGITWRNLARLIPEMG